MAHLSAVGTDGLVTETHRNQRLDGVFDTNVLWQGPLPSDNPVAPISQRLTPLGWGVLRG